MTQSKESGIAVIYHLLHYSSHAGPITVLCTITLSKLTLILAAGCNAALHMADISPTCILFRVLNASVVVCSCL